VPGFDIELEWGAGGIEALSGRVDHLVLIDILSFTTCVDAAVSCGAAVLPWRWDNPTAASLAPDRGARLAVRREAAGEGDRSLSPASLRSLAPGDSVVLPSPNGATLSVLARGHGSVWAGCLRNASALARELSRLGGRVGLIPAGERWSDGSLRPALEDLLGAGALAARLRGEPSPEALAAKAAFNALRGGLLRHLLASPSGRELVDRGWEIDVQEAAHLDASTQLCRLVGDGYVGEADDA